MAKHKHVSRLQCQEVPVDLLIALLTCVSNNGGDADTILRTAGATYGLRQLRRSGQCSIDVFTRANRLANAHLRDHIHATTGCCSLTEEQFYLLCKCLVACFDFEEVLRTTTSFFHMFEGRIGDARFHIETDGIHFYLNPLRKERNESTFLIDVYGFAIFQILLGWLLDEHAIVQEVELAYARPDKDSFHLGLFACPIRFGQRTNCLILRKELLAQPVLRDQADLTRLFEDFPFNIILGEDQRKLCDRVYTTMMNAYMQSRRLPTIADLARVFHTSPWTIRRRLTEEGTAYSSIKKKCQLNLATEFLKRSEMTIDEIAHIANFSDANAFRRAFHQWTGSSPTAYRRELLNCEA